MECVDFPGVIDQWGDDCSSYEEYPPYCSGGLFDTDTFKAEDACCVCGGGEKIVHQTDFENTLILVVLIVLVIVLILLIIVAVYLRNIYQRLKPEQLTDLNL